MGLEKYVDMAIEKKNVLLGADYCWRNGLKVDNALKATEIMAILDETGVFGPTRYNPGTTEIEFGVYKDFYKGDDYLEYRRKYKAFLDEKMEKITLRPFTKSDWYAFAGAEKPDGTTEPMIGECSVDNRDALIIIDAHGIEIYFGETEDKWRIVHTLHFNAALLLVTNMNRNLTSDGLENLGFKHAE